MLLDRMDEEQWAAFWKGYFGRPEIAGGIRAAYDLDVRGVINEPTCAPFTVDFKLRLKKLDREGDQKKAKKFIKKHHAHNPPPPGWIFGYAVLNGRDVCGIVWVGRPIARRLNAFKVIEINRNCVRRDLPSALVKHACSMLYGAAVREAEKRGYETAITYTLVSEPGTTLKAAGFTRAPKPTREGDTWDKPGRRRKQKSPTEAKWKWTRELNPPNEARRELQQREKDANLRRLLKPLWEAIMRELKAPRKRRQEPTPMPPPTALRAEHQLNLF